MKITFKRELVNIPGLSIKEISISAPDIAAKAKPGEFVVFIVNEYGERVPLTIVNADKEKGHITLIFQEAGFSTRALGEMNIGDSLYALAGPLGHAAPIKNYGNVILAGGGVGIAEIYPVAKAFKNIGNHVTVILGARTKGILILERELKKVSNEILIVTDDGSYGRKGFTTDILQELLLKSRNYALVYAVGPIPMMKRIAAVTGNFDIPTIVSLNAIMIDGTGMCGCCRVTIGNQVKFTCVDGPEFNAHLVNWDELEKRNRVYLNKEKHLCTLEKAFK